jgi:hypothetical protein
MTLKEKEGHGFTGCGKSCIGQESMPQELKPHPLHSRHGRPKGRPLRGSRAFPQPVQPCRKGVREPHKPLRYAFRGKWSEVISFPIRICHRLCKEVPEGLKPSSARHLRHGLFKKGWLLSFHVPFW